MFSPDFKAAFSADKNASRIDWVDYAKGICIFLVVMMHSTLGVGKATGDTGYMHLVVEFARPFRMPDFFLISGLFLASVMDRPWRRYFDRKVVHFFYFYVLWVTIQFAFKAPAWMGEGLGGSDLIMKYLMAYIQPFGTLWFIYILPVFFIASRLLERFDWRIVLAMAALLEIAPVHTGSVIVDEFASRFVYFYAGFKLAPQIFKFAEWALDNASKSALLLVGWAVINGLFVFANVPEFVANTVTNTGYQAPTSLADYPVLSLGLGVLGSVAVVLTATLVTNVSWSGFIRYLGANSIVVYLAFFLPMAISRIVLLKAAPFLDVGTVSLLVTLSGVIGALIIYWITQWTGLGKFLFSRPQWAVTDQTRVSGTKPVTA